MEKGNKETGEVEGQNGGKGEDFPHLACLADPVPILNQTIRCG